MTIRRPRLGSVAVVEYDDRVLLGVRDKDPNRGQWVIPGGTVEPGESPERAAIRELYEETGLYVAIEAWVGLWEIDEGHNRWLVAVHRAMPYFSYNDRMPAVREQPGTDLLKPSWASRDGLVGLPITPVCVDILQATGWLP